MKQIFTTLLLLTAAIISANAEMRTVWTGPHSTGGWSGVDIPSTNFSSLEYGDKLVFSVERDIDGATAANQTYYQCQVNVWVDGVGTPILNGENGVINIENDDDIEVNLTNEQVDLIKQNGMSINGHYVIFNNITAGTEEGGSDITPDDGTTTEIWSGSKSLGWDLSDNSINLSYDSRGALANAKIGDIITITFTNAGENANIRIGNPNGWTAFDSDCETSPAASTGEQTFSYGLLNATILGIIQRDGIIITGNAVTITKVELTTYPDSYDAVAVTIGTEGIATYSKSDKTIDFTNSGITAYYASAVETGRVTLTPISQVPEYTGIIVKGEPGTYEIPVIDDIDGLGTNYLKAIGDWEQQISASAEGASLYIFNESDVTFSLVAAGTTVEANKAYLETPTDITPAEGSIELEFEDEGGTGINNIETDKTEDDNYYNLQGMRVEHPTRGIYIHNGKKVIIR